MEPPRSGNRFKGITFIGEVVDNADPMKLERVRVRVPDVFDGVPDEMLPWAIPKVLHALGHGGGAHSCHVPVMGSLVYIEFQNGDPHFPKYVGSPVTPAGRNAVFDTNYPNRYGFADPTGNIVYVDMKSGDIDLLHFSGTKFHVDAGGNVTGTAVGSYSQHAAGPMSLSSDAGITLDAPTITNKATTITLDAANTQSTGNIGASGTILDGAGNSNNHSH